MKKLAALALAGVIAAAPAAAEDFGPLLSAGELALYQESADPLLVDIRGVGPDGASLFEQGHIAGSVSAPYGLFRGPAENPGQLVPEAELEATLRSIGVTKDRPTVIIYRGATITDFGAAARVYWTLKSSGVTNLAILNGGLDAWTTAGYALETGPSAPTPSAIDVVFSDQWLATTDDVLAVVDGTSDALLVDARPESFWKGEKMHPAAAQAGTLPGSSFLVHSSWFDDGAKEISLSDHARSTASSAGFTGDQTIVSFCNTGHWAATNWFALSELAGLEGVKLYPESMVGYSNGGYPMALGAQLIDAVVGQ